MREVIMARDEELDHLLTVLEYTQRCVLMIDDMTSTDDDQASFNPVLGFYCPATGGPFGPLCVRYRFNPVLGFYCPATTRRTQRRSPRGPSSFNPVLGFYCPATSRLNRIPSARRDVSIPFWVSTVLRPSARHHGIHSGFVSIPFWVSTVLRRT